MIVSVPASTANLGPGFDCLGLALMLPFNCGFGPGPSKGFETERHPAVVAFRRLGGRGPLWVKTSIPSGRGLGFSGAARVGGLAAALLQSHGPGFVIAEHREEILAAASILEGHADNSAASLYGGCIATSGGRVVGVPLALSPVVVLWIPRMQTSTAQSRGDLPRVLDRDDAVFNTGRAALLVGALASGDVSALRVATEDRLHQDTRFDRAVESRLAYESLLDAGAWCAWLSGSGPSVAAFCAPTDVDRLIRALPPTGRALVLHIDLVGAQILPDKVTS